MASEDLGVCAGPLCAAAIMVGRRSQAPLGNAPPRSSDVVLIRCLQGKQSLPDMRSQPELGNEMPQSIDESLPCRTLVCMKKHTNQQKLLHKISQKRIDPPLLT